MRTRSIEELQASEFPGVDPEKFTEWKEAVIRARPKTKIIFIIMVVSFFLFLPAPLIGLGVLFLLLVVSALVSRPSYRLQKELGLTWALVREARKRPSPPAPIESRRKCPRCAEWIQLEAVVCRFCGHGFTPDEVQRQTSLQREGLEADRAPLIARAQQATARRRLTTLKWLYYTAATVNGFLALVGYAGVSTEKHPENKIFAIVLLSIGLTVMVLFSVAAWSIGKRKKWGRPLALVIGAVSLPAFPIGTALGIYALVALSSHEGKRAFAS